MALKSELTPEDWEVASKRIFSPIERLRVSIKFATSVEIDGNIKINKYYDSGLEMIRMADKNVKHGNYENAFILYIKFLSIFIDKIRLHPEYNKVSLSTKAINNQKLSEVLPKAKWLKGILLKQHKRDYSRYNNQSKRKTSELHARSSWLKKDIMGKLGQVSDDSNQSFSSLTEKDQIERRMSGVKTFNTIFDVRNIGIPQALLNIFPKLVRANTYKNIESCALMGGILGQNGDYKITHLILPQQTGSYDCCTCENQDEVRQYLRTNKLVPLGWCHTHPTQKAFLTSVDLHILASFQSYIIESIAIVFAPSHYEIKMFSLTPDFGLKFINKCKEKGFHPHNGAKPLVMEADHCNILPCEAMEIKDFRKLMKVRI